MADRLDAKFQFRLTRAEKDAWIAFAERKGLPLGDLIRERINSFVGHTTKASKYAAVHDARASERPKRTTMRPTKA